MEGREGEYSRTVPLHASHSAASPAHHTGLFTIPSFCLERSSLRCFKAGLALSLHSLEPPQGGCPGHALDSLLLFLFYFLAQQ